MSEVNAFRFPRVSKKLPKHVIENLVDEWCVRDGAIRYHDLNDFFCKVYVDVVNWLPPGYEMRDKLTVLKAMGKFDKKDIPVHNLKFGRYLLVCPSYTLAEHEAYMQRVESVAVPEEAPFVEEPPQHAELPSYYVPYFGPYYFGVAPPVYELPEAVTDSDNSASDLD